MNCRRRRGCGTEQASSSFLSYSSGAESSARGAFRLCWSFWSSCLSALLLRGKGGGLTASIALLKKLQLARSLQ